MRPKKKGAMRCPMCGGALEMRHGNYPYLERALPNVTLVGIEIHSCPKCGEEMPAIPRIEELHRTLAFALTTQPARLHGPEIRFLRTYLGWSGKDFARTMGVTPETVSRWENDKEPIGIVSDRLLRTMVLRLKPVEEYPTERLAELGLEDAPARRLGLAVTGGSWKLQDAA